MDSVGEKKREILQMIQSDRVTPGSVSRNPVIIVLSAKNKERLKEKAQQLLGAIREQQFTDLNLADAAYTLQVGREAMEERLAVLVGSIKDLEEKLKDFVEGRKGIEDLYLGQVRRSKDSLTIFSADEELQEAIDKWIRRGKYAQLLDLWVKGMNVDWDKLYGDTKPGRISLPTYPFARERYWAPRDITVSAGGTAVAASMHPLLQQNTSDLTGQRYSSTFTGREFFLADHVVRGQKVLPGVAYLEMAREAVERAAGALKEGHTGIRLKNVVWVRPIAVEKQPVRVHIGLFPEDSGEIGYEVYSEAEDGSAGPVICSQGSAALRSFSENEILDIKVLRDQCSQDSLSSYQCYESFRAEGLDYGPGHQGIEVVYVGQDQVLAKLRTPSSISGTRDQYVLHPSLMDSALQASIGLMSGHGNRPALPFALHEIDILGSCTSVMWAHIRYSYGSTTGDRVQKLDIDLCDSEGVISARMKGLSLRVPEGEQVSADSAESVGTLMLHPCWKENPIARQSTEPSYEQHIVLLCEPDIGFRESIEAKMSGVRCITLQSKDTDIEKRFQTYVAQVLEEIQGLLKDRIKGSVLIQLVIQNQGEKFLFTGLSGLLKTARHENKKIIGQLIELAPGENSEGIVEKLKENSHSPADSHIRYQDGIRYTAGWSDVDYSSGESDTPWKDGGIYLITGGAGDLGLVFAREIASKARETTLILTGRSPLDGDRNTMLKKLEAMGARIEYRQTDVTQQKEVADLILSIRDNFGNLHGIIHSAGVIRDNFVRNKTREEMEEVLSPKVAGLVNLDQASKDLSLDFFVLFSSMAGSLGNVGQADYSAANAFMDAYAGYRNGLVASKQRRGQTLSINWPMWKDGGMRVGKETEKMMMQSTGMLAMETTTGIRAFYRALASGKDQVMVMDGKLARMKRKLLRMDKFSVKKHTPYSKTKTDDGSLLYQVEAALMQIASRLIKVRSEDIDAHTELNEYGFDSVTLTEFANKLNQLYKLELTPAIFFEYSTLHSFAEYLLAEYQAVLAAKYAVPAGTDALEQAMEEEPEEIPFNKRPRPRFAKMVMQPSPKQDTAANEPIAIVGMSGRFPMSKDVHEFWRNLVEGKDCITEIPKDRWDWREYYGDPLKEANKTKITWGGFIEGVDEFDPLFFGISPREAELMDPQQRLLMIYAWKAIEDAGYSAQELSGTQTAIFVGTGNSGYSDLISRANVTIEGYSSTGTVPSVGPNRMSYFLNIHGPSEPIETACSSSLVAIHRAVGAIENGNCEMAIVGGVNTILTPQAHISFNKAGMLCEDGRCKTFSDKANGYVRGEGVGMLFLKRLKAAEEAGDQIYGVIRGTAENHGGRANSLTAPNPRAQAELLKAAYTKAGIDPGTVNYIEAHGTGTEIGDPIEINGLKKVFKEMCQATGETRIAGAHCGLGAVKTNVGHLELAAGIVSVIKVLLQLKHKTLVKSLHCDTINPYIELKDSPFYIVQENEEWKAMKDSQGKELPRRAGVSSFGYGGVNAHVVIEEYIPKDQGSHPITITTRNPAIILLSAKNDDRLREQAQQLLAAIKEQQFSDLDLADMAYTLQVGREAMEERLALIVSSIKELKEKLRGFVEGRDGIEELYRGQVKRNKETLAVFAADEELQKAIEIWIQRGKYAKLLDLWVKGLIVDWSKFYGSTRPRRISLPTYPFAGERYWVPMRETQPAGGIAAAPSATGTAIHPLLHQNTSDLTEQRFSATFTGQEFFLADHVVQGERVLPGVAYLEMARAAVEQAAGALREGRTGVRLKNVVWARPIAVGEQPVKVNIGLFPKESREVVYEIYSESERGAEPVVHSQGSAILSSLTELPSLNLKALQDQCSQSSLSSIQCYEAFKTAGIEYGPGHQGIEKLYVGSGQVLAKLSLPFTVSDTLEKFVLHPGLMDSAIQASIGLTTGLGATAISGGMSSFRPLLPFALQELEVFGACTSAMWALIRYSSSAVGDKIQKLNIDLCDSQGTIRVRMKGVSLRVLEGKEGGTLMFHPYWKEQAIAREVGAPAYNRRLVVLCEPGSEVSRESINTRIKGVRCLTLKAGLNGMEERFQAYAAQVFEEIQSILKDKSMSRVLIQIVVPGQGEQQLFAGLTGLLKTARLENPKAIGQLIEVDTREEWERIIDILQENTQRPTDTHIRYHEGKRHVAAWSEIEISREEAGIPWKDRGTYLISGGAGSLGLIFAREIAQKSRDVTLILTGRSSLSEDKQVRLKELEALGARIEYRQVDVTQRKAVTDLFQSIQADFGSLQGIIHSAGITRDNFIIKKTREELQEVLGPKVTGTVNLDQASKDMDLDFFILFSSIAGGLGNIGQADYAAANAFMDVYARYRNSLVNLQQRQGHTLSINWPLWQEGGMLVDEQIEKMKQSMGMIAIQTPTGIRTLYQGLASGKDQLMIGDPKLFRRALFEQQPHTEVLNLSSTIEEKKAVVAIGQDILWEKAINYFKMLVSSVIKLPPHRIEAEASLEKYGIDSMMAIQLTNQLEKEFGSLSKTLFFEYQNIQSLTGYFVDSHRDRLMELLEIGETAVTSGNSKDFAAVTGHLKSTSGNRHRRPRFLDYDIELQDEKAKGALDIAIIGVSGRYPKAENIQELWENLRDGRDCVTEIPEDRWEHSLYFDEDKNRPGKTYSKWGGFLNGVDQFDPLFFNISPKEAEFMDPNERLFLETVWNLMESTGYTRETLQRKYQSRVGVYVGAMYQQYHFIDSDIARESAVSVTSYYSIANRVSYFFNMTGPSIAVDTACSSALVSIHLACESLIKGECKMAIAGGVNLSTHPKKYLGLSQGQIIGSHDNSRSFASGDGYIPSEGVGAVLLKPMYKAVQDGDNVLAVIKSTTTNHGGQANGFSVPNPNAQAQLIEDNFIKSGINPRTISYVEAAANGSALGDPIEVTALSKAFAKYTHDDYFCAIGSVKSNIGHAEAASGMAQLTKVILQLQHGQLVPSIKAEPLNQNLSFNNTPFFLQQKLREWKRPVIKTNGEEREYPRRATISSFGAGGSNAHLIIEEYIHPEGETGHSTSENKPQIIVLSARNQDRLEAVVQRMLEFLEPLKELPLFNLAYTLQVGREEMEYRLAMVVKDRSELIKGLKEYLNSVKENRDFGYSIPIFAGNLDEEHLAVRTLLAGKTGEAVIEELLQANNLEKIALYWTQGGNIPWKSLHKGNRVRMMALPTYPFAKERFWVTSGVERSEKEPIQDHVEEKQVFIANNGALSQSVIQENIVKFLSQELNLTGAQVKLNKNMRDFGADSITGMKLIRHMEKKLGIKMKVRELVEYPTIKSLSTYLERRSNYAGERENTHNEINDPESDLESKKEHIYDREYEALEKFKQGILTLEELRRIVG